VTDKRADPRPNRERAASSVRSLGHRGPHILTFKYAAPRARALIVYRSDLPHFSW
jgi:hypothetical protein